MKYRTHGTPVVGDLIFGLDLLHGKPVAGTVTSILSDRLVITRSLNGGQCFVRPEEAFSVSHGFEAVGTLYDPIPLNVIPEPEPISPTAPPDNLKPPVKANKASRGRLDGPVDGVA